jgi:hypothetical protein
MFSEDSSREGVDAKCRKLTASWVRDKAARDESIELCSYFEEHEAAGHEALLPPGGAGMNGMPMASQWPHMNTNKEIKNKQK